MYKHLISTQREQISALLASETPRKEIADEALCTKVYFADSFASWQKDAVENANKHIRQYFPKGTDFRKITDSEVLSVQHKLNRRPREKLNFSTPTVEFFKHFS